MPYPAEINSLNSQIHDLDPVVSANALVPASSEAALAIGVFRSGQSGPPVQPAMVSLHVEQVTPEAPGMDIKTRASSSPDEHGSLEPRQDEPSPTRPRANEPDPRDPCRVSGPPQIIINHGRHAIVASDLSTQIHGELHTSQLGTFSGGICGRILQTKKRLPLSTVQSELTNGGVRPH